MKSFRLPFSFMLLFLISSLGFGEARCPANVAPIHYHSLLHSHMAVSVIVNGSGPYEFLVDTGAQITTVDPALAAALNLEVAGSVCLATLTRTVEARRAIAVAFALGSISVERLPLVVQDLGAVQAEYPKLRGILGNNFLERFDVFIDNRQKLLCFDASRRMQQSLRGDRVPILSSADAELESGFAQLILITVHLPGDGPRGSMLRLDSGVNFPLLYEDRQAPASPRVGLNPVHGGAIGKQGQFLCAWTPERSVRFGPHQEMQIAFAAPAGRMNSSPGEDGLLPTALFHRVFISFADHFVIFEPR